jgi:hypothetical protein
LKIIVIGSDNIHVEPVLDVKKCELLPHTTIHDGNT